MSFARLALVLALATVAAHDRAEAQAQPVAPVSERAQGIAFGGGVTISTVRVTQEGGVVRAFAGPVIGAEGRIGYSRYTIEGRYAQGTLSPEVGTLGDGEDYADVVAQVRALVLPWLSLGVGPHLRAFITPAGTARWSRIEGRVRLEGDLIPGVARAHAEGWYAFAAEANVQGGGTGAQGSSVGLSMRIPRTRAAVQLSYTADHATFTNGNSEFLQGVGVAVVIGRF